MKILVVFLLLAQIFQSNHGYKILGIFPLPSKSHMVMFEGLMQGLAEKGHEVDVVSHFPRKKPLARYTDLSLAGTMPVFVNNISVEFALSKMSSHYETIQFITLEAGLYQCKSFLNSTVGKQLKETEKKYDLIITEIFGCDCTLGFAHLFNIPVIGLTSSVNLPWGADRIGNPDNPAYIPNYLVPYLSKMNLMERLTNTVVLLGAKIAYMFSEDSANEAAREFFGKDLPELRDLAYNTSLIMVNSHFSTNVARPTVPNFIEVGGIHIGSPKPLPKHLEAALNVTGKYKGVIYFSMGSMVLTETLPVEKLSALFETFRELPYKVLWKATREKIPSHLDIPSNIHFESWMPQLDILCHPNVKLFVSHGGLMGTQEGIYCGVPRLGIPLFADQELNLKASQAMGLAIMINYNDITKQSVSEAAKALLEDPKYKSNAEKVSKLFRDRPLSALDTAIYWVEYVIRHNGAPHLRTVGADLSWYQYYLLDVGAILASSLFAFLSVLYYTVSCLLRRLVYDSNSTIRPKRD